MNKDRLRAAIPSLPKLQGRTIVRPAHAAQLLDRHHQTIRALGFRGLVRAYTVGPDVWLDAEDILAWEPRKRGRKPGKAYPPAGQPEGVEI